MPNRLATATSPYLLQHQDNPVDWYEWGEEAFAAAGERDVPVLLSVGYSACHWCHVMAHESFEDEVTAAYMNEHFINVKVDREERPDVDRIYMDAVQAMSGRGGWPMTVFLTPQGRPFHAGTYYPKDDRPNYPSFRRVLAAITEAWAGHRDEVEAQAARLTTAIRRTVAPGEDLPTEATFRNAVVALRSAFDVTYGGFGGAPKFPQAPTLEFLLRNAGDAEAAEMLHRTLHRIAAGGIRDHLGGGFARYSVDRRWLVPHFEKMLYDNALLARLYLRAGQVLDDPALIAVGEDTLDYMLRDLALPGGGFASAEDADSEGEEGKFYVWSPEELDAVLGSEVAAVVADHFGVTEEGNFEGANVLSVVAAPEVTAAQHGISVADLEEILADARSRMLAHRSGRVRPGLDDKAVTAWNGLALRALAVGALVTRSSRYLDAARANARFVLDARRRVDCRLLRSWREGRASVPAFAEDYAAYAMGLFALYRASGELEWYRAARDLVEDLVKLFSDEEGGGFFTTGDDAEALIARPEDLYDNPTPSANALAAEALSTLAAYTGENRYAARAERVIRRAKHLLEHAPQAVGHLLAVAHTMASRPPEVAVVGPPGGAAPLLDVARSGFRPGLVIAYDPGDGSAAAEIPLLAGRAPVDEPATAYVCRDFVCDLPTTEADRLADQIDTAMRQGPHPGLT